MEPTTIIPKNNVFFQLEIVFYSASSVESFDICDAVYHYQGLKNMAVVKNIASNANQIMYQIKRKDKNTDDQNLYETMLFIKSSIIKKILLKAVPCKGNTVELVVPYFSMPKIFFANHGKRKFSEPLSKTSSFNIYATPHKKMKCVIDKKGNYYKLKVFFINYLYSCFCK